VEFQIFLLHTRSNVAGLLKAEAFFSLLYWHFQAQSRSQLMEIARIFTSKGIIFPTAYFRPSLRQLREPDCRIADTALTIT
jgi:hypothetical protein